MFWQKGYLVLIKFSRNLTMYVEIFCIRLSEVV